MDKPSPGLFCHQCPVLFTAAKMKAKLAQDSSTDTCGDLIGRYAVYRLSRTVGSRLKMYEPCPMQPFRMKRGRGLDSMHALVIKENRCYKRPVLKETGFFYF